MDQKKLPFAGYSVVKEQDLADECTRSRTGDLRGCKPGRSSQLSYRFEPATYWLQPVALAQPQLTNSNASVSREASAEYRARTVPPVANQALLPAELFPGKMVGLSRFELLTPRLSSVCSNQLSYRPSRTLSPRRPDPELVDPHPHFNQRPMTSGSLKTR